MRNNKPNKYNFDWENHVAVKTSGNTKWVQYSDYEKLKQEYEKVKAELDAFKNPAFYCGFNM